MLTTRRWAPPPADAQWLMFAVQGNAKETSRFMGTMTGAVSVSEFYSGSNVARIPCFEFSRFTRRCDSRFRITSSHVGRPIGRSAGFARSGPSLWFVTTRSIT